MCCRIATSLNPNKRTRIKKLSIIEDIGDGGLDGPVGGRTGKTASKKILESPLKRTYEARVRFGTWVRVRVRVRDLAIFEKVGCGCGGTRRLKNY